MEKSKSGSQVSTSQRELEAASKSSLVTALLDSVTSSMQNQSQDDDTEAGGMDSPSLKKRQIAPQNNSTPSRKSKGRLPSPIVSDYGDDDDLDDEFLMLEETMLASQATQASQASQTAESVAPAKQSTERAVKEVGKNLDKNPVKNEFDDFDDDDFDAADDLLASLELKTPAAGKRMSSRTIKTPRKNKTPQKIADLEDEFGDDAFDGEVDFEAVEFAATQAAQQQDTASTSVCEEAIWEENMLNVGQNKKKVKTIQRYLVTSVLDGEYVDQYNRVSPEKVR